MIDFHVPVPLLRTWKSIDAEHTGFEPVVSCVTGKWGRPDSPNAP